ncbi:MAG TPA: gamma subclass chorismate mutase AroQ [Steroidobacteraceae bacterium]|nr:gamma subclass chorismate mutase AroQ [Steroidobacteraceae bacterium]
MRCGRVVLALAVGLSSVGGVRAAENGPNARFADETEAVEHVLALADERLALMPAVAAWKWRHDAPVSDPARERAVIDNAASAAARLGLAAEPVQRVFEVQMSTARAVEEELQRRWRARGFDFAQPIPSLQNELRPRLDRITQQMLRALYGAAPACTRADFVARFAASAASALHSAGWSQQTRQQLLEALGSIRLAPAPTLARIQAAGVLRIGTTGDYAPFSVDSAAGLTGVDIELARRLAQQLHVMPLFVRTSWPALLSDFDRGAFDVALSGISSTPARAAVAALSDPYLWSGKTLIARCTDVRRFSSLAALDHPQVRVIVNPGGTNESYVRNHLKHASVRVYADNRSIFDEIRAARADVMITDDAEVELQVHAHPDLCRPLAGTLTHDAKVVLMARDAALVGAVNAWLRAELRAGVPSRLLRQMQQRPCSRGSSCPPGDADARSPAQ